jgi:hypothetical protein
MRVNFKGTGFSPYINNLELKKGFTGYGRTQRKTQEKRKGTTSVVPQEPLNECWALAPADIAPHIRPDFRIFPQPARP